MSATAPNIAPSDARHCPKCRAELRAGATRCWLCEAEVQPAAAHDAAAPHAAVQAGHADRIGRFSLASLMMFMTLLCVILGVSSLWPGVGIPLGLIVLVVWIRTSAVARKRLVRGLSVTRAERTQLFLASFGVTLALVAVTCVAGCAAFVAACFACVGTWAGLGGDERSPLAMPIASIVFSIIMLAIVVPVLWWIGMFVARRWQRDTGAPDNKSGMMTSRRFLPVSWTRFLLWIIILGTVIGLVAWLLGFDIF